MNRCKMMQKLSRLDDELKAIRIGSGLAYAEALAYHISLYNNMRIEVKRSDNGCVCDVVGSRSDYGQLEPLTDEQVASFLEDRC
jgi:hypothetical protein